MDAIAKLEERRAAAPEVMDNMEMMVDITETFTGLCDDVATDLEALRSFGEQLATETSAAGVNAIDEFGVDADAEAEAKNTAMDELHDKWAFFLKHNFAFEPYEVEAYLGYVQGQDYSGFPYFEYSRLNFSTELSKYEGLEGIDLNKFGLN
jgi:hypothetical protein